MRPKVSGSRSLRSLTLGILDVRVTILTYKMQAWYKINDLHLKGIHSGHGKIPNVVHNVFTSIRE